LHVNDIKVRGVDGNHTEIDSLVGDIQNSKNIGGEQVMGIQEAVSDLVANDEVKQSIEMVTKENNQMVDNETLKSTLDVSADTLVIKDSVVVMRKSTETKNKHHKKKMKDVSSDKMHATSLEDPSIATSASESQCHESHKENPQTMQKNKVPEKRLSKVMSDIDKEDHEKHCENMRSILLDKAKETANKLYEAESVLLYDARLLEYFGSHVTIDFANISSSCYGPDSGNNPVIFPGTSSKW
jgi:hypothetical protein